MATKDLVIGSSLLVTYNIKDQDGREFGHFSFSPSDTDIVKRHKKVVSELEKIEIPENEDMADALERIDELIYKEVDYLLGANVSESFFSIMGPFSPLENGQFFIEAVLDAIGQAIQNETGKRVEKIAGKINKHTSKYHG